MVVEQYEPICTYLKRLARQFSVEFDDLHGAGMEGSFRAAGSWNPNLSMSMRWWLIRGARSGAVDYMRQTYGRYGQKAHLVPRNCPWPTMTNEHGEQVDIDIELPDQEDHRIAVLEFADYIENEGFTERQRFLAIQLGQGTRQVEIALLLGITPSAVSLSVKNLRERIA